MMVCVWWYLEFMLIDPSDYLVDGFTLWCGDDKHYHTRFGGINIQPYQLFWGFHYRLHFDPFHQEIHEKREDLSQKHLGVNQQHRETTNQTYCAECRITLLFKCTYNNGKVIGIYGLFLCHLPTSGYRSKLSTTTTHIQHTNCVVRPVVCKWH